MNTSIETDCASCLRPAAFTLTCVTLLLARFAIAESVQGTATWCERVALSATAVFEAVLEDTSRADALAEEIARMRLSPAPNPPISFEIAYDPARERDTTTASDVADTTSEPSGAGTSEPASDSAAGMPPDVMGESAVSLESTRWNAVELEGTVVPRVSDPRRRAHIVLDGEGRFAGSDGCNRMTGSYQVNDDAITFGQAASTQMACLGSGETERQFRAALDDARSYRIVDDRLELSGIAGTVVARFEADDGNGPAAVPAASASALGGTSWRLVRFEGSDDTTLTPDDPAKYTFAFTADGSLTARVDCNRGRGTWESSGPGQLMFSPLALTRAMCPPGSLHDQIVRQWSYIRSYVLKDGHLFLALMADGGIYEFESASGE